LSPLAHEDGDVGRLGLDLRFDLITALLQGAERPGVVLRVRDLDRTAALEGRVAALLSAHLFEDASALARHVGQVVGLGLRSVDEHGLERRTDVSGHRGAALGSGLFAASHDDPAHLVSAEPGAHLRAAVAAGRLDLARRPLGIEVFLGGVVLGPRLPVALLVLRVPLRILPCRPPLDHLAAGLGDGLARDLQRLGA
jgi:hypothetical protein